MWAVKTEQHLHSGHQATQILDIRCHCSRLPPLLVGHEPVIVPLKSEAQRTKRQLRMTWRDKNKQAKRVVSQID